MTINPYQMLLNAISSLTQPLFAQGRLKANLSVAQSQQEQAQIAFEKALLVAGGEVRDALADCQACSTREEARTKQVEAARHAYENSRLTMQYANTSYLEVLIAQSAWLDAQLQQTADWLEKQQSGISLFKAVCGGDKVILNRNIQEKIALKGNRFENCCIFASIKNRTNDKSNNTISRANRKSRIVHHYL